MRIAVNKCSAVSACVEIGAGSSRPMAPDTAKAGEPILITLQLLVWGQGGHIKGRHTNIKLFYRLVGEFHYRVLQPQQYLPGEESEFHVFVIPPFPKGASGEIEFYLSCYSMVTPTKFPARRESC